MLIKIKIFNDSALIYKGSFCGGGQVNDLCASDWDMLENLGHFLKICIKINCSIIVKIRKNAESSDCLNSGEAQGDKKMNII